MKYTKRENTNLKIIVWVVLIVSTLILLPSLYMRIKMVDAENSVCYRQADAVIVLGASVRGSELSPVLQARVDAAMDVYQKGYVKKILVSGTSETDYDEVSAMRDAFIARNVSAKDLFVDRKGLDTFSSIYRARYIYGIHSAIIPTQDFHMPRVMSIARYVGIEAYAYIVDGGDWSDSVREVLASCKATFDFVTHREPQYLGMMVPIHGRSNVQ